MNNDDVLPPGLREHALAATGFMPPDEGDALYAAAMAAARAVPGAPFVEVGSYCGRSSVWLGGAARAAGTVLFAGAVGGWPAFFADHRLDHSREAYAFPAA